MGRYWIPNNFGHDGRYVYIMGLRVSIRKIVEAAITFAVIGYLISLTPFIQPIRLAATIVLGGGVALVALIGINGESLSQFIVSYIRYRKNRTIYHLRQPGYLFEAYQKQAIKEMKKEQRKIKLPGRKGKTDAQE